MSKKNILTRDSTQVRQSRGYPKIFYTMWFLALLIIVIASTAGCKKKKNDPKREAVSVDTVGMTTFTPVVLSPEIEVGNPGKGFYQMSSVPFLNVLPKYDIYMRFSWRRLELSEGVYDFSPIDIKLTELKKGQRFSFRVMALNTCCSPNKNGADVPDYVVKENRGWFYPFHSMQGSDSIFVPDWNDPVLLNRMEKLVQALAKRYDNDPRVGWIENGLYGNWGEWHTYPIQYPNSLGKYKVPPPSSTYLYAPVLKDPADTTRQKFRDGSMATKQKILYAHTNAFKHKQLIQSTGDLPILFEALSNMNEKPMGIRRDSWGDKFFNDITMYTNYKPSNPEWELFDNRWKTAPFYTENWGSVFSSEAEMLKQIENFNISAIGFGNLGTWTSLSKIQQDTYLRCARRSGYRYQISQVSAQLNDSTLHLITFWKNVNIAPSYENWLIKAYIINPKSGELFSSALTIPINLMLLLNDKVAPIQKRISLPLKAGWRNEKLLQLRVLVTDSTEYLQPMNIDMAGRNDDGSYTLLSI